MSILFSALRIDPDEQELVGEIIQVLTQGDESAVLSGTLEPLGSSEGRISVGELVNNSFNDLVVLSLTDLVALWRLRIPVRNIIVVCLSKDVGLSNLALSSLIAVCKQYDVKLYSPYRSISNKIEHLFSVKCQFLTIYTPLNRLPCVEALMDRDARVRVLIDGLDCERRSLISLLSNLSCEAINVWLTTGLPLPGWVKPDFLILENAMSELGLYYSSCHYVFLFEKDKELWKKINLAIAGGSVPVIVVSSLVFEDDGFPANLVVRQSAIGEWTPARESDRVKQLDHLRLWSLKQSADVAASLQRILSDGDRIAEPRLLEIGEFDRTVLVDFFKENPDLIALERVAKTESGFARATAEYVSIVRGLGWCVCLGKGPEVLAVWEGEARLPSHTRRFPRKDVEDAYREQLDRKSGFEIIGYSTNVIKSSETTSIIVSDNQGRSSFVANIDPDFSGNQVFPHADSSSQPEAFLGYLEKVDFDQFWAYRTRVDDGNFVDLLIRSEDKVAIDHIVYHHKAGSTLAIGPFEIASNYPVRLKLPHNVLVRSVSLLFGRSVTCLFRRDKDQ